MSLCGGPPIQICSFYEDTTHIGLEPTPHNFLDLIISLKNLLQIYSHSEVRGPGWGLPHMNLGRETHNPSPNSWRAIESGHYNVSCVLKLAEPSQWNHYLVILKICAVKSWSYSLCIREDKITKMSDACSDCLRPRQDGNSLCLIPRPTEVSSHYVSIFTSLGSWWALKAKSTSTWTS